MVLKYKTTADIPVAKRIVDQVIGQEAAVNIIKKAAQQRRHVFLIGEPGTGKSMLGMALAELLPKEKLVDILAFPNPNDENQPLIRTVPASQGRQIIAQARMQTSGKAINLVFILLILASFILPYWWWRTNPLKLGETANAIIFASSMLGAMLIIAGFVISLRMGARVGLQKGAPKLIVDNFDRKQSPFFDATGSIAGALLGDVLHDPFQCFIESKIYVKEQVAQPFRLQSMQMTLESLFARHKPRIISKGGYEAMFLPRNELFTLGELHGALSPVEVLSCNRQEYKGKAIRLTTSEGKSLITTPEHKLAVSVGGKIAYKQAKEIKEGEEILSKQPETLIGEQDIINTYGARQQEQCRLYFRFLGIKAGNPAWGYKRIAKAMGQPSGKTRWWHAGRHIPVPIQTVRWLAERGLLPMKEDDPRLPLVSKVLGATFGDGGIFENLNGIFLSSSERGAVEAFGKDIEQIFGLNPHENSRIVEGGEKGHSWCYQNANRNIIRFFLALGAPKGNKTHLELEIPNWVYVSNRCADEFFGAFLGGEIGVPKVHKQGNRLQTLDVAITGPEELGKNRVDFLNKVRVFLEGKGIQSTSLVKRSTRNSMLSLYRLLISVKFDNVVKFVRSVKINYCDYKRQKLARAINEYRSIKKRKYHELIARGYGAETAMRLLLLNTQSLYLILNEEEIAYEA